jgi:hypothetical protein
MMRGKLLAGVLGLALLAPGFGFADPWKDESGNDRWGHRAERSDDRDRGEWRRTRDRDWDSRDWRRGNDRDWDRGDRAERRRDRDWDDRDWRRGPPRHSGGSMPPGHRPPPGYCRDWIPGVPPGHQPPPYRC